MTQNIEQSRVLFQVNAKSLNKASGSVYKIVLKLINLGLIDFIGSDTHRMRDVVDLQKIGKGRVYKRIFEKNEILNMCKLV